MGAKSEGEAGREKDRTRARNSSREESEDSKGGRPCAQLSQLLIPVMRQRCAQYLFYVYCWLSLQQMLGCLTLNVCTSEGIPQGKNNMENYT